MEPAAKPHMTPRDGIFILLPIGLTIALGMVAYVLFQYPILIAAGVIMWALNLIYTWWINRPLPGENIGVAPGRKFFRGHEEWRDTGKFSHALYVWAEELGLPAVQYWGGMTRNVLLTTADDCRYVLHTKQENFSKRLQAYQSMKPLLGEGLLTVADEGFHAKQRRAINPAFSPLSLKSLLPVFIEEANLLVKKWDKRIGQPVDVHCHLSQLTVDIIGRTAFNFEFHELDRSDDQTTDAGRPLNTWSLYSLVSFLLSAASNRGRGGILSNFLPSRTNARMLGVLLTTRTIVDAIVRRSRADVLERQRAGTLTEGSPSVFDKLVNCRDSVGDEVGQTKAGGGFKMSEALLRENAVTILLAGHETTSTAMSWLLLLLAKYPEAEERCLEEIMAVCPEGEPTMEQLKLMPYTLSAIKEAMRLYPPAPSVVRRAETTETLPSGVILPKGQRVLISPYVMHHLEANWPHPEEFQPERFLSEGESKRSPYLYMPFLHGKRNCIGQHFAMLELQVFTVLILRRFKLSMQKDTPWPVPAEYNITMRPMKGLAMDLDLRVAP